MTEAAFARDLPAAEVVDVTGRAYDGAVSAYDFEDDMAEGDYMEPEGAALMASPGAGERQRRELGKLEDKARTKVASNTAAPEPDPADGGEAGTGGSEPAVAKGDEESEKKHGREIIYVAGMHISVYDLETAATSVETIPDRYGGWLHQRSSTQLVLRIPAAKLKSVMAELAELGVVEAQTLQAQDVTAEYVDLESRIKVLRETQTQLLELLGKAKTVEEALHVRNALDDVTMELEVALGRMRQLSDLISFSTLTVTLVERGPQQVLPTSNDPFRWVDELGVDATEWR